MLIYQKEFNVGCDYTAYCRDCNKAYYLGYGSYNTWAISVRTIKDFDGLADEIKSLSKNKNYRKFLTEHEGHNFVIYSSDYTLLDKELDCIMIDGSLSPEVYIKNASSIVKINLDE